MTAREKVFSILKENWQKFCDDCISENVEIYPRQAVNQICNAGASQGIISRDYDFCSGCGKYKILNKLVSTNPPVDKKEAEKSTERQSVKEKWYWEGNVQSRAINYLVTEGYKIKSAADTSGRTSGKDIVGESKEGVPIWVNVKGYPDKIPNTQVRHWFVSALLVLSLYRNESYEGKLFWHCLLISPTNF